jgi:methionyl-tRNA formyltransferase
VRILCCVNRDLASNHALNLLLPELHEHAVRVVLSERVGQRPPPAGLQPLRIVEQDLPLHVLFPYVEAHVDRAGRWLTFSEFAEHCEGQVPRAADLNTGDGAALLHGFAPDLILSIRYAHILRQPVIDAARLGVLNLHSGLLPEYRGILGTLYAMAAGDADVGCTLHWIEDPGIDTGSIVAIARRPVERGRSLLWHVLSLYPLGVPLMVEAVRRLTKGEAVPRRRQTGAGTYRSTPGEDTIAALRRRGFALVDAEDVREVVERYAPQRLAAPTTF